MNYPSVLVVPLSNGSHVMLSRYTYVGNGNYSDAALARIASFDYVLNLIYQVVPRASASDVAAAQRALNQQMGAGLAVDGVIGPGTAAAITAYQTRNGLLPTGVLDFGTRQALVMPQAITNPTGLILDPSYGYLPPPAQSFDLFNGTPPPAPQSKGNNATLILLAVLVFVLVR